MRPRLAAPERNPTRASALILILFLAWAFSLAWSFADLAISEITGSTFSHGIKQLGSFLAWQVAAILLAAGAFLAGWMQPYGLSPGIRRLTKLPLFLSAGLWVLIVIAGITLFILDHSETAIR